MYLLLFSVRTTAAFPPVQPSLRIASTAILNPQNILLDPRTVNSTPLWVIVHRIANSTTLLKRLRNSLTVYCWSQYRLRLGPRSSIPQQAILPSSATSDPGSLRWRFPLLIDGLRGGGDGTRALRLWTLNSKSNEVKKLSLFRCLPTIVSSVFFVSLLLN